MNTLRSLESDLHKMQMRELALSNQIKEKTALEERVATWRQDIVTLTERLKVCTSSLLRTSIDGALLGN